MNLQLEKKYAMCGGCGATHPRERCIGCFHYFGEGSWNTDDLYKKDKVDNESRK